MTPADIDKRLLNFSADVIRLTQGMKTQFTQRHISHQLIRSATSPLANYGEAQAAESDKDFIHKMSVSLKELRESHRWLQLIQLVPLSNNKEDLHRLINENDQLCRIFNRSIKTVKTRLQQRNNQSQSADQNSKIINHKSR